MPNTVYYALLLATGAISFIISGYIIILLIRKKNKIAINLNMRIAITTLLSSMFLFSAIVLIILKQSIFIIGQNILCFIFLSLYAIICLYNKLKIKK